MRFPAGTQVSVVRTIEALAFPTPVSLPGRQFQGTLSLTWDLDLSAFKPSEIQPGASVGPYRFPSDMQIRESRVVTRALLGEATRIDGLRFPAGSELEIRPLHTPDEPSPTDGFVAAATLGTEALRLPELSVPGGSTIAFWGARPLRAHRVLLSAPTQVDGRGVRDFVEFDGAGKLLVYVTAERVEIDGATYEPGNTVTVQRPRATPAPSDLRLPQWVSKGVGAVLLGMLLVLIRRQLKGPRPQRMRVALRSTAVVIAAVVATGAGTMHHHAARGLTLSAGVGLAGAFAIARALRGASRRLVVYFAVVGLLSTVAALWLYRLGDWTNAAGGMIDVRIFLFPLFAMLAGGTAVGAGALLTLVRGSSEP